MKTLTKSLLIASLIPFFTNCSYLKPQTATKECCGACQAQPVSADSKTPQKKQMGHGNHSPEKAEALQNALKLIHQNKTITRSIEKLPNGVKTKTTTSDPSQLETLRQHPRQMLALYKNGGMVRGWDPVFVELSRRAQEIDLEILNIENGVEVLMTSKDREVVKLIQTHADKVNEFTKRGMAAFQETTAMPEGYQNSYSADSKKSNQKNGHQVQRRFRGGRNTNSQSKQP